jgi:hypothetical protein
MALQDRILGTFGTGFGLPLGRGRVAASAGLTNVQD